MRTPGNAIIAAAFMLVGGSAPAVCSPMQLKQIGEWPGYDRGVPKGVYLAGTNLYAAIGRSLHVFGIANSTNLTRLATGALRGQARDVQVAGGFAYLAAGTEGIEVFDVSHLPSVTRVGGCPAGTLGEASCIAVTGNYAYLGDNTPAIYTYDISDPSNVVLKAKLSRSRVVRSLRLDGDRLYVHDGAMDVLSRANPTNLVRIGGCGSSVWASDVIGNRAYLAADYLGLEIYDTTDPLHSVRLGGYDTSSLSVRVSVQGNLAYLSDSQGGFHVLDVTDPANVVRLGGYTNIFNNIQDAKLSGGFAYVMESNLGLRVFDVRVSANVTTVGLLNARRSPRVVGGRQPALPGRRGQRAAGAQYRQPGGAVLAERLQ